MSSTKYEVMCRYYNVDMKMSITNLAKEKWVSCFNGSVTEEVSVNRADAIKKTDIINETFEFCTKVDAAQEKRIQDLLISGNNSSNPKFNMFFMYNSRDFKYSNSQTTAYPYVLMDKMDRIILSPWFIHSTHSSLKSAMVKTKALANLIGHENIKIAKIVPLDQYIEIV